MKNASNCNDWVPIALFAATSWAFTTILGKYREGGNNPRDDDLNLSFRQIYRLRRRRDRLSYTDMNSAGFQQHIAQHEDDEEVDRSKHGISPRRTNTSVADTVPATASQMRQLSSSQHSSDMTEEFTPKNRNWDHFEPFSRQEDEIVQQSYGSDDEDSDQSPEETFVWTSRQHSRERSSRNLSEQENMAPKAASTWARFRSQLSRPFSNDYDDEYMIGDEDEERYELGENINAGEEADAFLESQQQKISPQKELSLPPRPRIKANPLRHRSESSPDILSLEKEKVTKKNEIAQYNARIMPHKVIMVRHGQSMGNVNESLYATTPDNAMRITQLGWEQARMAGKALREEILATNNEPVHFIVSPYVRTVETFHGIVSAWCDPHEFDHIKDRSERVKAWYGRLLEMGLTWHEDPRIREQDFGNYQDPVTIKRCKKEREKFGSFFYRFPHGESASDVFDRVSTFLDSLWRSFDSRKSRNYVLITHGISVRVFLARYFRYTIEQFSMLSNPRNCEMVMLGHDGEGKLRLQGRCEIELKEEEEQDETTTTKENGQSPKTVKKVSGYRFHKRLNVLPKKYIRKVTIRISPDDVIPTEA